MLIECFIPYCKKDPFNFFFFSVFLYESIKQREILCLWPFMVISEHHLAKLEEQTLEKALKDSLFFSLGVYNNMSNITE